MPNWCSNTIRMKNITSLLIDGVFDFNTIIPMPPSLKMEDGSNTRAAILAVLTDRFTRPLSWDNPDLKLCAKFLDMTSDWGKDYFKERDAKTQEQLYKDGLQYVENIRKYEFPTWFGWCNAHWGTKWNACYTGFNPGDPDEVSFETAWQPPFPVVRALSEKFPGEKVEIKWKEESGWYGKAVYLDGEEIHYEDDEHFCGDDDIVGDDYGPDDGEEEDDYNIPYHDRDTEGNDVYHCWRCEYDLERSWNYCPSCGTKIDWRD